VRADRVAREPSRRVFINTVMDKELGILNEDMYKSHLNIVRQRMKKTRRPNGRLVFTFLYLLLWWLVP
jgi:hypothetical protein